MYRWLLGLMMLVSQYGFCVEAYQAHPYIYCQKKWKELKWEGLRIQLLKLRAESLPQGQEYTLFIRNFDGSQTEVFNYIANKKGHLIVNITEDFKKGVPVVITPLRRGEKISYCMFSKDRSEEYRASIVPFPIQVKKKGCIISMELIDIQGESFMCVGEGFSPLEELHIICQLGESIHESVLNVDARGMFQHLVFSSSKGQDGGQAVVIVKTKKKRLALPFMWGTEAQEFVGAICLQIK